MQKLHGRRSKADMNRNYIHESNMQNHIIQKSVDNNMPITMNKSKEASNLLPIDGLDAILEFSIEKRIKTE